MPNPNQMMCNVKFFNLIFATLSSNGPVLVLQTVIFGILFHLFILSRENVFFTKYRYIA